MEEKVSAPERPVKNRTACPIEHMEMAERQFGWYREQTSSRKGESLLFFLPSCISLKKVFPARAVK